MTEQDKQLIPFIHCLAVGINAAEALRFRLLSEGKMPKQTLKRDLNKSFDALDKLQDSSVETANGKVNLLDIFFSDDKQVVNLHTSQVLESLEYDVEAYIAMCLVIASVLEKMRSIQKNSVKKGVEFWHYVTKIHFPMRPYFKNPNIQQTAVQVIDTVTNTLR